MKKYQLKRIDTNQTIGNFDSKADATNEMAQIIEDTNDELQPTLFIGMQRTGTDDV